MPTRETRKEVATGKQKDRLANTRGPSKARSNNGAVQPHQSSRESSTSGIVRITWTHGIFGHKMLQRFKSISRILLLLRGVIIWYTWQERNEVVFDGKRWHMAKLYHKVWLSMIDYGKIS